MTPRGWKAPPELAREIASYAEGHLACGVCGAQAGTPCTDPGDGRTVHGNRWAGAAIEVKRQRQAARLTPARRAALGALARLPKVPRAEIEAYQNKFGRETLARWGVPWPPPAGWRKAIERPGDEDQGDGTTTNPRETR